MVVLVVAVDGAVVFTIGISQILMEGLATFDWSALDALVRDCLRRHC